MSSTPRDVMSKALAGWISSIEKTFNSGAVPPQSFGGSPSGVTPSPTASSSPRDQIRTLLAKAPQTAKFLAREIGLTRGGVLRWLRKMEAEGEVEATESSRRSPHNRWRFATPKPTTP